MSSTTAPNVPLIRWPREGLPFSATYCGLAQRYRRSVLRRLQPLILVAPLVVFSLLLPGYVGWFGACVAFIVSLVLASLDYIVWDLSTGDLANSTRATLERRRAAWREIETQWITARQVIAAREYGARNSIDDLIPSIPEFVWPIGVQQDLPPVPIVSTFAMSQLQLAEASDRIHRAVVENIAVSGFDGLVLRTSLEGTRVLAIGYMAGDNCQVWLLARFHQSTTGLAYSVRGGLAHWTDSCVLRTGQYYRGDQVYLKRVLRRVYWYALSRDAVTTIAIWLFCVLMLMPSLAQVSAMSSPEKLTLCMALALYAIVVPVARGHDWPCLYSRGAREAERTKYRNRYPDVPGEFGDLGLLASARQVTFGSRSPWASPEQDTMAKVEAIKQQVLHIIRVSVMQQSS